MSTGILDSLKAKWSALNVNEERELTATAIPMEFTLLEKNILTVLSVKSEGYEHLLRRFLEIINAIDQEESLIPDHLYNAVAKKMLYEYFRLYRTLNYPLSVANMLTAPVVMRPLTAEERPGFIEFCIKHSH